MFLKVWNDGEDAIVGPIGVDESEFEALGYILRARTGDGSQWGNPTQGVFLTWVDPIGDGQDFYDWLPPGMARERFAWFEVFVT